MEELIEWFSKMYPDKMVLDKADEFSLGKKAGKVELIEEMKIWIREEYGNKFTK